MKYLKTFENINNPKVGDFVVINIKDKSYYSPEITFFDTEIGRILRDDTKTGYFKVEFDVPFEGSDILFFNKNDIEFSSDYKRDCKMYISSKRYNL